MRRRVLLCLTLIFAMSACNGDRVGTPIGSASKPTNDISDATHTGAGLASNRDFFFLPPMVKNPSGSVYWDAGGFNANLRPTVEICASSAATEEMISVSACAPLASLAATVSVVDEHYKVNWPVPSTATKYYRMNIMVGSTRLGYADIATGANMAEVKSLASDEVIALLDGRTLPIKFRIERYALCEFPGDPTRPCTSTVVSLATGGTATDAAGTSGVTIPAQAAGAPVVTITVADCEALNARVTDLPVYGVCKRITANPSVGTLTNRATVFNCAVNTGSTGLTPAQAERLTMHQFDDYADARGKVFLALPRVAACQQFALAPATLPSLFADLTSGRIGAAARQALSMLAPKDLHAARFIDQGGGGLIDGLSDFQLALPSKMEIFAGNTQTARPGTLLPILPTVKVTDLDNRPVQGARITFATSDGGGVVAVPVIGSPLGTCQTGETCASVITDANGFASASWTLRGQDGPNALRARGRGIGGTDFNGPRGSSPTSEIGDTEVDPFQPIQTLHDAVDIGTTSVVVRTGSVLFSANGQSTVLIYGPSLFTGIGGSRPHNEQTLATAAGFAVTVWDAATWASKTTADFAKYSAIIIPDPMVGTNCSASPAPVATAEANAGTWGASVNGPVVVIGTDPVFHQALRAPAVTLMRNAIRFAASAPTKTGLYATLNCYYNGATAPTGVAFLSGIGTFTVVGVSDLGETATILDGSHPVMASLTPADLSNWNDSAHEAFPSLSSYPSSFVALAQISRVTTSGSLTYIIARP